MASPVGLILKVLRSGISTTPSKMGKAIPDRWIPYKACGQVIEGTRIVCFKVPLQKVVQEHVKAITEVWDINTLLTKLPNLGAVVDLTNTARYYNPKDLHTAGVLHRKILMPGRVIPPEKKVLQFMDTIDEFLGKDCDIVIGVHCTHGLNRTGYMVCRYMRDRLGIPADDAISRFEKARGYKIERENYVADLLGKKPPPPDIGVQETEIKPFHHHTEGNTREDNNNWRSRHNRSDRTQGNNRVKSSNNWRSPYNRPNHTEGNTRPGSSYDRHSTQYRSPLDQYDNHDYYQGQPNSNRFRSRYFHNSYNRNGNRDRQGNNSQSSGNRDYSSGSSSRWDMSNLQHRPR